MTISDALKKPAKGVSNWHIPLNENFEKLKAAAATVKSVADGIEFQNPANGTSFLRYNTNTDTVETSKNLEVSGVKFNNKADLTQSGGVLVSSQLPDLAITNIDVVANQSERLGLNAEEGDVAIQTDISETFILSTNDPTVDSNWKKVQLDVLGAIDGQQITPSQTGTSTNPTTVVASSVTEDGNNVVTSPNADRDVYVIQSGASAPSAATNDDIILEKK